MASPELIELYREISDLTLEICSSCNPPYHCCELAGCEQARFWAKLKYGVELKEIDNSVCVNCGDGSGWLMWKTKSTDGTLEFVWVACADCNDDRLKPKPKACDHCGETRPFCQCQEHLPFLAASGCIVAPHHRRLCSTWLCREGLEKSKHNPRILELKLEIMHLEEKPS